VNLETLLVKGSSECPGVAHGVAADGEDAVDMLGARLGDDGGRTVSLPIATRKSKIENIMALFGNDKFRCARCGQKGEPIGFAPIPTELGTRIGNEICRDCWKEWQQKQMQLINHFGIDVSNPDAHQFLFDQMKIFFYGEGVDVAEIDTSQEGKVNW